MLLFYSDKLLTGCYMYKYNNTNINYYILI